MARRSVTPAPAAPPVEPEVTSESETAAVLADPETVAAINEAQNEDNAPSTTSVAADTKPKTPAVLDMKPFEDAVKEAIEARDESTGTVDVAHTAAVVKAYQGLGSTKGKTKAKNLLQEAMREAVTEGDIQQAKSTMDLFKACEEAPSGGSDKTPTPKVPVDPTVAFVQKDVQLRLALVIHEGRQTEDIKVDWFDQATAKLDELTPQIQTWNDYQAALAAVKEGEDAPAEPELAPEVKVAFNLAAGKAAGVRKSKGTPKAPRPTGDGERHDIAKHITEALADKPVGTFLTVAELRSFNSKEYGEVVPSAGAINARLFPVDKNGTLKETTVKGVRGVVKDNNKGAEKVAEFEKAAAPAA